MFKSSDTKQIISKLKDCYNASHVLPIDQEILAYINKIKFAKINKMVNITKQKTKRRIKTKALCKKTKQNIIRKALSKAKEKAILAYENEPIQQYSETKLHSEDGWKNRMIIDTGEIVFVFKGYCICLNRLDDGLHVINITQTFVLQSLLKFLDIIFHLDENGCIFDERFLRDKLNAIESILNTKYSDYLPCPPRLRRSYNGNLYDLMADVVVSDGWSNNVICTFDENCKIFKFGEFKYIVDMYDGRIDRIMEF
jgi:hypothetical protein